MCSTSGHIASSSSSCCWHSRVSRVRCSERKHLQEQLHNAVERIPVPPHPPRCQLNLQWAALLTVFRDCGECRGCRAVAFVGNYHGFGIADVCTRESIIIPQGAEGEYAVDR